MARATYAGFQPFPKRADGKIDRELVKKQYMDSQFIEWASFCNSMGYSPTSQQVPHRVWREEKRKKVVDLKNTEIKEKLFDHSTKWHLDILDTIHKYPEQIDNLFTVVRAYTQEVSKAVYEQKQAEKLGIEVPESMKFYRKFKLSDIKALVDATHTITEAKYKALLLNNWSAKLAQDQVTDPEASKIEDNGPLTFEIKNKDGSTMSDKELTRHLAEYYDKPYDPARDIPVDYKEDDS